MVKTVSNTAERDAFIAEARKAEQPVQTTLFSFDNLKKLSNDELIERIEQVDAQALIIKWRIWWTLRQRFKKNVEFGHYVAKLRENPDYAHIVGSQQNINCAIHAGKFCEKHKITSLDKVGVLRTVIYELSKPINEDIADGLYKQIKHKNMPVIEVQRLIAQAKAVNTEPQPVEPIVEPMPYEPRLPSYIPVINNVAQLPEEDKPVIEARQDSWIVEQPIALSQPEPKVIIESIATISHPIHGELPDYDQIEESPVQPQIIATAMQIRVNAIMALPRVKNASDADIASQARLFFDQFEGVSYFRLSKIQSDLAKESAAKTYRK